MGDCQENRGPVEEVVLMRIGRVVDFPEKDSRFEVEDHELF